MLREEDNSFETKESASPGQDAMTRIIFYADDASVRKHIRGSCENDAMASVVVGLNRHIAIGVRSGVPEEPYAAETIVVTGNGAVEEDTGVVKHNLPCCVLVLRPTLWGYHAFSLLGKQHGEHLGCGLAPLQEVMRIEDQRFNHGFSLLPTRLPNGFDGVTNLLGFPSYR